MIDQHKEEIKNIMYQTCWMLLGKIIPLDGHLDPYFQEVCLDAESRFLVVKQVNEYFQTRLTVLPKVTEHLETLNEKQLKK